ncbi:Synaptotagmin-like protein 2 [Oryzias melastigma]|uniref:Synaptotagmin-like protein 2 n=1 Tax=Oryzias melastigma TaxID=30732 RepID=A0A834CFA0_ORYME|nr:Synaptotagmin-like protein 2 [Oryzias melastigma]
MIDLSFLTEEEQNCILDVLKRDAELKQTEERRIETLQKTVSDKSQLKFLTGEWFYQTKQLRHQDRIHGSDIIMASMADRRHQPLTINYLFIFALFSSVQKRENPFDDQLALKKQDPQLVDAREDQCLTQKGGECKCLLCHQMLNMKSKISPDSFISNTSLHKLKTEDNTVKEDAFVPFPALETAKLSMNSQDGQEVHKKRETLGHSVMEDLQNIQEKSTQDIKSLTSSEAKNTNVCEQCYFEPIIPAASSCVSALEEPEKRPFFAKARSSSDERCVQSPEDSSDVTSAPEHNSESSPQVLPPKKESKCQRDSLKRKEQMSCTPTEDEIEKKSHKQEVQSTQISQISIHKNPNVRDSFSSQTGHQKDTADRTKEKDVPSQMETDMMQDDGTYRASPVFIFEDDSLLATELKITEPEDSPVPPLLVNSSLVLTKPRSIPHEGMSEHLKDKKTTSPEEGLSSSFVKDNPGSSENRETSEEYVDQINPQECLLSDSSQMSSFKGVEAHEQKMDNESRERSPNFSKLQFPKSKDNFDKIRKSPSKTYHPNVLPQESSSAKESRLRESPLKTFPIDIVPKGKVAQESKQKESFSPVKKQREQTNTTVSAAIFSMFLFYLPKTALSPSRSKKMKISYSLPLQLDQRSNDNTFETSFGHRRNTNSSISDMSFPSEMDSMSPVCQHTSLNSYLYPTDEGLAVGDTKKNRTDPYVKCNLLPDKTKLGKKKTPVKKKTTNPTYNEVLGFKIPMEVLKTQHLNVTVSHKDSFGRSAFLGEVDLDLSVWDFSNTQINEYPLKAKAPVQVLALSMNSRGEMRVALRFLQQPAQSAGASRIEMGEVQIWVKDCKNLLPVRGSVINPFVKCTVLPDMSSKSRQKTRVVKKTASPLFNHTMVYDGFRPEDLREICVEITVWDQDQLKNYYIGGLRLGLGTGSASHKSNTTFDMNAQTRQYCVFAGRSYEVDVVWMDSTAHEVNLWNRMLKSGGEWVEEVLPLRFLTGAANSMSK